MIKRKTMYFLAAAATAGVVGLSSQAFAHSGGSVSLLEVDGGAVGPGIPYSPKATCARSCHDNESTGDGPDDLSGWSEYAPGTDMTFQHDYESSFSLATKTQVSRDGTVSTYEVPYPTHGVSAGYHFQQGMNVSWAQDQKDFYHVPNFTSSPGMYGKY